MTSGYKKYRDGAVKLLLLHSAINVGHSLCFLLSNEVFQKIGQINKEAKSLWSLSPTVFLTTLKFQSF